MKRRIIHTLSLLMDWAERDVSAVFDSEIHPTKSQWSVFLKYLLLATGIIFFAVGVIFFFAFNWGDIPKMMKFGLIQGLIVLVSILAFWKSDTWMKEILLVADVLLIGALFAVFGQIYQTGANAYDFFLGWTIGAFLWIVAGNTLVLWTMFLLLINMTVVLYFNQVQTNLLPDQVSLILFGFNGIVLLIRSLISKMSFIKQEGKWFHYLLTLFVFGSLVFAVFYEIFEDNLLLGMVGVVVSFPLVFRYAFQKRDVFYIGVLGFSGIVLVVSFVVHQIKFNSFWTFLLLSIFIIVMVGILVQYLLKLNKRWYGSRK